MTPAEISDIARRAGGETGECYPGDTPWRRRFAELVADATSRDLKAENQRLREQALTAEKWRGIACAKEGDGRTVQRIENEAREPLQAELAKLRDAISYYAESSNWRRAVRNIGPRKAWTKPPVASDRGGLARLTLMELEGAK